MQICLKDLRTAKRITQQEIADYCGVSKSFISRIEKGSKIPTLALAENIADCLNIPLDELVGREPSTALQSERR